MTGNEDGAHDAAGTTLFNLCHLGCAIAPNADCYWSATRAPVPARILREHPIPPEGNTVPGWQPMKVDGPS